MAARNPWGEERAKEGTTTKAREFDLSHTDKDFAQPLFSYGLTLLTRHATRTKPNRGSSSSVCDLCIYHHLLIGEL